MKYKKKFNSLIILILFFTITISLFTIPFMIQAGHYATATLSTFFLLAVSFLTGYRISVQIKNEEIELLVNEIKSRVTHNVRHSVYTNHLSDSDISELNRRIINVVNSKEEDYFKI
jgi:archaellum biogenesis protein FlaJ (TadC family)